MKFTLSWLKDHIETNADVKCITDTLINAGIEVEDVYLPKERFNNIVVGYVAGCKKHPNADKLSVCTVDDGSGELKEVVCGAPNVRKELKIVFARIDAIIPFGNFEIKKTILRGVESCGMICSSKELELGGDSEGIMELDTDLPLGENLATALSIDDPVFDVSITPNRGDLFSVRGIARELAVFGIGTLKPLDSISFDEVGAPSLEIEINDEDCPYFTGRFIEDIQMKDSPKWMKNRLNAVGQKSISAVVDITNYVCFDIGRPMHAFDADKINKKLIIKKAKNNESFKALNEETYMLTSDMMVIADKSRTLSIAGIMGGLDSGCISSTKSIFLESAYFNPKNISLTGQKLNLLSESRTRFERGVDPDLVDFGLNYATKLILKYCGGKVYEKRTAGAKPDISKTVSLSSKKLSNYTNGDKDIQSAKKALTRSGFSVLETSDETLKAASPSYRQDITCDVDLIEEVIRFYGYNSVKTTSLPLKNPILKTKDKESISKEALLKGGMCELYTLPFVNKEKSVLFGHGIEVLNPINSDLEILRPSTLISLLNCLKEHENKSISNLAFFEVTHNFQNINGIIRQPLTASGVRSQKTHKRHWKCKERDVDVFDVKADVLNALSLYNIKSYKVINDAPIYYHPSRKGSIAQGNTILAYFGEIHPRILSKWDLKGPVVAFEILLDNIRLNLKKVKESPLFSSYQPVTRDFSFVIDISVSAEAIINTIYKIDPKIVQDVLVFDIYKDSSLPKNKQSLSFCVTLQAQNKTLTENDLNNFQDNVIKKIKTLFDGDLRE
ncbi:MAG: phenylalanine--tRNA ligase subunit beta [Alphaproteobacteria bacterium]